MYVKLKMEVEDMIRHQRATKEINCRGIYPLKSRSIRTWKNTDEKIKGFAQAMNYFMFVDGRSYGRMTYHTSMFSKFWPVYQGLSTMFSTELEQIISRLYDQNSNS